MAYKRDLGTPLAPTFGDDKKKKKKKKKKPTPVSTLKKITKDGNTTTTITRHPSGEVTKSVLTKKMKSINN